MGTYSVFVSSTFADMQAERDYLRSYVFPELEERLRKRRQRLEWVDLRVGVATSAIKEETERELQVLRVCVDEIRRCRPFLIVLLGDRYGWVPPGHQIKAASIEASDVLPIDMAGSSVTELEIEFGILSNKDQQPRSHFYFRKPLSYGDMPHATAASYCDAYASDPYAQNRVQRLSALKGRIERLLPGRVKPYNALWDVEQQRVTGLEAWGRAVVEDIWSDLEQETADFEADVEIPWQLAEREALNDFIDDRTSIFVGRKTLLDRLVAFANSPDFDDVSRFAFVTGQPGSGKSALFSQLTRRLGSSDCLLLSHSAGASPRATSVDVMLRRWTYEISRELGLADHNVPEDAAVEMIDAAFNQLLRSATMRGRRVVILIDALDQLENTARGQNLTWVSSGWPDNVRMIVTTTRPPETHAREDFWCLEHVSIPPLDHDEARGIVEAVCDQYHRKFEPEVIDALLTKDGADEFAWRSPLWLVLATEELNNLNSDDFFRAQSTYPGAPAEQLRALMVDLVGELPGDIPGLYRHAFERARSLFGIDVTFGFLGLIAVARAGWREADFRVMLPRASGEAWDELRFAQLRRLFRGQLLVRGRLGQWDFNHLQMRIAAQEWLANHEPRPQVLHAIIADRLLSCPPNDPLRVTETMLHLLKSEDWSRARRYYGGDLPSSELAGATAVLANLILFQKAEDSVVIQEVAQLLHYADGEPDPCDIIYKIARRFLVDLNSAIQSRLSLHKRADLFNFVNLSLFKAIDARKGNEYLYLIVLGFYFLLGDIADDSGDPDQALAFYKMAQKLARAASRDAGTAYDKMGNIHLRRDEVQEARSCYEQSLSIKQQLVTADPNDLIDQRNLSAAHGKVGDLELKGSNYQAALQHYRAAVDIVKKINDLDPTNPLWRRDLNSLYGRIGNTQWEMDELDAAVLSYQEALSVGDRLAQSDPNNLDWQNNLSASCLLLGRLMLKQGSGHAVQPLMRSVNILERLTQFDPDNFKWQENLKTAYHCYGDALALQRDDPGAIGCYERLLGILDRQSHLKQGAITRQRLQLIVEEKINDCRRRIGAPSGDNEPDNHGEGSMTPAELVEVVQDEGYRAKLVTDSQGKAAIETKIRYNTFIAISLKSDKLTVNSLRFSTAFADGASPTSVNGWNANKRFVSVYLDDEGRQVFQMDAVVAGATRETFAAYLSIWDDLMRSASDVTL